MEIREFLWPAAAERDEPFRREMQALSRRGLRVLGWVSIAVAMVSQIIDYLTLDGLPTRFDGMIQSAAIALVGAGLLALSRTRAAAAYGRAIGLAAFLAMGAILTLNSLLMARKVPEAYHYVPGTMSLVMMVAVGTLPLRPVEAFGLGLAIELLYALALRWARAAGWVAGLNLDGMQFGVMLLATLLAAVLAAVLYAQRRREYLAHEKALRERCRTMLSENGASMGRLAAALSHELNTPLGALASSADSLVLASERLAQAEAGERERLALLVRDLRTSILDSAGRLREITGRMQRFAHLDRAETQTVELPQLLADVVELVRPRLPHGVEVTLSVGPVPPLRCRPQQLSSAFFTLLANAAAASPPGSRVSVSARAGPEGVEVTVEDRGPGLAPGSACTLFEPSFRASEGRVTAANLGLFAARQIVLEHGGEILAASGPEGGTAIRVCLPVAERSQ